MIVDASVSIVSRTLTFDNTNNFVFSRQLEFANISLLYKGPFNQELKNKKSFQVDFLRKTSESSQRKSDP